jgi:hypothetical protein
MTPNLRSPILVGSIALCFNPFLVQPSGAAAPSTVSNVALRYDTMGRVVNAHDGCLVQFPSSIAPPSSTNASSSSSPTTYWLYGTVYEACEQQGAICDGKCGYLGNLFAAYSSPDLMTWTLESANVLPALAADNDRVSYWEANVAYNTRTSLFVMVYWSGHFGFVNNSLAVATSPSAAGPFVPVVPIALRGATVVSDTVALFVDDDGTAYARYNTIDLPRRHVIERLTPDWMNSTGEFAVIFEKPDFPWMDGGGLFKRGSLYYTMLSFDCCFCSWGSDALVFVAPSPLGPWTPQGQSSSSSSRGLRASLPPPPPASSSSSSSCNLTGAWSGVLPGHTAGSPSLFLVHPAGGDNNVSISGAVQTWGTYFPGNNTLVIPSFPGGAGTLVGAVQPFNGSTADPCSEIVWLPPYQPPGAYWCRSPACGPQPEPPNNATNEVNFCADGTQPPSHVADMTINPCSQEDVYGTNFTIPAQQFGVAVFTNASSPGGNPTVLFFGEHFKSAADGLKSHDLQAWIPLSFAEDGTLLPMVWMDEFELWL